MSAFKLYNPEPVALTISLHEAKISIPSKGYAVVGTLTDGNGNLQERYPALEVVRVDDFELDTFRSEQAKVQREAELAAAEAAKHAAKEAKAEAVRVEEKIAKREADQKEARKKAAEEKLAVISGEAAAIKKVTETTVVSTGYAHVEVPEAPKRGRPKKGQ